MSLLIDSTTKELKPWVEALKLALPNEKVITLEELENPDEVVTAVVWNHHPDLFNKIPNVRHIASLGAGVDHILKDPYLPKDAFITRIISDYLSGPMSNYCLGAILYFDRKFDKYLADKKKKIWDQEFDPERHLTVGILGLGELGSVLARKLVMLDFRVSGMSITRKSIPGVESYVTGEMDEFLKSVNLLVCMLPATDKTKGILSYPLFSKMKKGSYLVNVARGEHQVDEDIIRALDEGYLEGAFLDVFPEEPLSDKSPLWEHPGVVVTPHIAVVTKIDAAVPIIAENHNRVVFGGEPEIVVDVSKGY